MKKRIIGLVAGLALAGGIVVASTTPVGAAADAAHCKGAELKKETGAANVTGAQNVSYTASTSTATFTFVLEAPSCSGVNYVLNVYAALSPETLVGSSTVAGDGASTTIAVPNVVLQGYDNTANNNCVTAVAETVNASTGAVIDRAPDTGTNDICDGSGNGLRWT